MKERLDEFNYPKEYHGILREHIELGIVSKILEKKYGKEALEATGINTGQDIALELGERNPELITQDIIETAKATPRQKINPDTDAGIRFHKDNMMRIIPFGILAGNKAKVPDNLKVLRDYCERNDLDWPTAEELKEINEEAVEMTNLLEKMK